LGYCDLTARLDNFAITLTNTPKANGYIFAYAPPDAGQRIAEKVKDYLVNSRGIVDEDLVPMYAGRNNVLSELRLQLWLVPNGALPPAPVKYDSKPEAFKGMFYEHDGYDEVPYPGDYEEFGEGLSLGVTFNAFTDVFKQQPKSVVYVVGYNGETSAPGAWRRIAEDEIEFLRRAGFEASRFKTIYGGNVKEAKVQVWIQPSSDPPPVEQPEPENAPKAAIQMGDYGEGELGYAKYERTAFKRLTDTLRSFSTLRACVIVRVKQAEEKEETEQTTTADEEPTITTDGPAEPQEPTPEPADLFQLVEKWKRELSDKHQLREDRFVVLFSKALPGHVGSLETWLVPPGESLPDPEALLREAEAENQETTDGPANQSVDHNTQPVIKTPQAITILKQQTGTSANAGKAGKQP
jgi:hypothetical protein